MKSSITGRGDSNGKYKITCAFLYNLYGSGSVFGLDDGRCRKYALVGQYRRSCCSGSPSCCGIPGGSCDDCCESGPGCGISSCDESNGGPSSIASLEQAATLEKQTPLSGPSLKNSPKWNKSWSEYACLTRNRSQRIAGELSYFCLLASLLAVTCSVK